MAFASVALARPAPNVIGRLVRDEDYDVGYKRSATETFVCKRDDEYEILDFSLFLISISHQLLETVSRLVASARRVVMMPTSPKPQTTEISRLYVLPFDFIMG